MAGHNRVSLTSHQTAVIKEMASKGNSNGAIAAALDVKKSTVAHVAKKVRSGAGAPARENRDRPQKQGRPLSGFF
ncbi:hypothetical protein I4F81_000835 [Pyropia yezoensis]|uniref:Uncharacterized protein n=1 Tax=Pyropia yezoensis TaxID=2788 RepID=A0ACC3BJU2_PYRYE|nr:hypothetical protein I4F81_000835 [Neopyropia yezoensis]